MTTTTQPNRPELPPIFPKLTLVKPKPETKKTSDFSVQLAGYLVADRLWEAPTAKGPMAPVWMAYLASPAEAAAFTANFRARRTVKIRHGERFRLPKRSGHRFVQQTLKHQGVEAALTVAYLPELFRLTPTTPIAPGDAVRFVFSPPRWWVQREAAALADRFGEDACETAEAALFVAFLDRRIHLPIAGDLRFHLALYRAAKEADWLSLPDYKHTWDRSVPFGKPFTALGVDTVLAVSAPQRAVIDLVRQLTHQHREEIQRGTTRSETSRRLLQDTICAATQLCFDFEPA